MLKFNISMPIEPPAMNFEVLRLSHVSIYSSALLPSGIIRTFNQMLTSSAARGLSDDTRRHLDSPNSVLSAEATKCDLLASVWLVMFINGLKADAVGDNLVLFS
jgi:hypothetical protein